MFPSSDPAIPNISSLDENLGIDTAMPAFPHAIGYDVPRNVSAGAMDMSPTYSASMKTSPMAQAPVEMGHESAFAIYNEYAPVQPPARSSKTASYSQLSASIRPSYPESKSPQHGESQQSSPDPSIADGCGEGYHGASDISIRRSASSEDAELFSDVEDINTDDEASGFSHLEPTEVADLPTSASGALDPQDEAIEYSSDYGRHRFIHTDPRQNDSEFHNEDDYRFRTASYESYPDANSPTESQLIDEGFEFHNMLPEGRHGNQFDNEAFRDALKHVSPELPRKQQWYAWRKVMEMLDKEAPEHDGLFDDSDLVNDFSLGSLANHTFGGCHCGGDENKCTCPSGQCGCSACPRKAGVSSQLIDEVNHNKRDDHNDDEEDIPMVIGYTPITPAFPHLQAHGSLPGLGYHHEEDTAHDNANTSALENGNRNCGCSCGDNCQCPENDCRCPKSEHYHQVPRLTQRGTDVEGSQNHKSCNCQCGNNCLCPENDCRCENITETADNSGKVGASQDGQLSIGRSCGCSCGNDCQCPENDCRCERVDQPTTAGLSTATTVEQLFDDPFKRPAAYFHPQETWSDAATAAQSPAPSEFREPRAIEQPFHQIATQLSHSNVFRSVDDTRPPQGNKSPGSYMSTPPTPLSRPVSRPDTPRPQGDSYEHGIRQSVEPELLSPISHRLSTPGYEDRSHTPSPPSHNTPSDTSMHDATPTQLAPLAPNDREGSVLPDAPSAVYLADSPPDSPSFSIPPVPAIPANYHTTQPSQYSRIPVPPIPLSPTLRPRKQRANSSSAGGAGVRRNTKSGVHGSKISKAQPKQRNVTRKATGKKVQAAVNRIEDNVAKEVQEKRVNSGGSVRSWDASEEVTQKNGSPPRRSARVRQRTVSPSILAL